MEVDQTLASQGHLLPRSRGQEEVKRASPMSPGRSGSSARTRPPTAGFQEVPVPLPAGRPRGAHRAALGPPRRRGGGGGISDGSPLMTHG